MKRYIYLSATPESLIASQLPPEEFGNYLAVGTKKRMRGQAIFFEVDESKMKDLPGKYLAEHLVPYDSGEPKRSVYISIYRVMEGVSLDALKSLYLVTYDGRVLELGTGSYTSGPGHLLHLYQQFNPIETRVASKLNPPDFIHSLTDHTLPVYTPKLFIVELKLNELATDLDAPMHNLPYPNPDHLKDCLKRLRSSDSRTKKKVIRQYKGALPFRTVDTGFFIGDHERYLFYPFPSVEDLETKHFRWWRSALEYCF